MANIIPCNQIEEEVDRLKDLFEPCYQLKAEDLDSLSDLVYSASLCSNQTGLSGDQNNKIRTFVTTGVSSENVAEAFNSSIQFTVEETEIFNVINSYVLNVFSAQNSFSLKTDYYLLKTGKGTYGLNSNVTLENNDFLRYRLSNNIPLPPTANGNNVVVIELNHSNTSKPEVIVNTTGPYTITENDDYYFIISRLTISNTLDKQIYRFTGDVGTYGLNNEASINDDFLRIDVLNDNTFINEFTNSGLESVNEGNGDGYRLIGKNPDNFLPIGLSSIDLGFSTGINLAGTPGSGSLNVGGDNILRGNNSLVVGSLHDVNETADNSLTSGYNNTVSGYSSNTLGTDLINTGTSGVGYSFVTGRNNSDTAAYGATIGTGLIKKSQGTIVLGKANADYVSTGDFNSSTNPILVVGNGTLTNDINQNANVRSDALVLLNNGLGTLPSVTNTLIDSDPKAIITKEYFDANSGSNPTFEGYNETGSIANGNLTSTIGTPNGINSPVAVYDGDGYIYINSNAGTISLDDGSTSPNGNYTSYFNLGSVGFNSSNLYDVNSFNLNFGDINGNNNNSLLSIDDINERIVLSTNDIILQSNTLVAPNLNINSINNDVKSLITKEYLDNKLLFETKVTVTNAEMLSLSTTPKILIKSAGANKAIDIVSIICDYQGVIRGYTTGNDLQVQYNTTELEGIYEVPSTILTNSTRQVIKLSRKNDGTPKGIIGIDQAVTLNVSNGDGNPTNGVGDLVFYIAYRIIDLDDISQP